MTTLIPTQPANSFRVTLNLDYPESRIDNVLLNALREQNDNLTLKHISRASLKNHFTNKKVLIKGQRARSSSSLEKGVTYVDIVLK